MRLQWSCCSRRIWHEANGSATECIPGSRPARDGRPPPLPPPRVPLAAHQAFDDLAVFLHVLLLSPISLCVQFALKPLYLLRGILD
jgi:hypothetical protein